jgi:hypothetical protein
MFTYHWYVRVDRKYRLVYPQYIVGNDLYTVFHHQYVMLYQKCRLRKPKTDWRWFPTARFNVTITPAIGHRGLK